jgi:protocatechuate 3,4-dioxygenase beta subunit
MNKLNLLSGVVFLLVLNSCGQTTSTQQDHQTVLYSQDTCNNPDAHINCCFVNMPASLTNTMIIADKDEPGERLIITGTIYKQDGTTPYADVIMYAYHTNNKGIYAKRGNETGFQKWHGHLHGWCKTDSNGNYIIETIRPASYPNSTIPAHIHIAIKRPQTNNPFYINDFVFKDDPFVDDKYESSLVYTVGGNGILQLKKENGMWIGKREMILKE